jgi:hypothetical protein
MIEIASSFSGDLTEFQFQLSKAKSVYASQVNYGGGFSPNDFDMGNVSINRKEIPLC